MTCGRKRSEDLLLKCTYMNKLMDVLLEKRSATSWNASYRMMFVKLIFQ